MIFHYVLGDGNSDLVICFYCDKALKDWQKNEEPWREHAIWKSDCSYILLSKGKNVIDELRGLKNDTPNIDSVVSICFYSHFLMKLETCIIFNF